MGRYRQVWLEIATEQFAALPEASRQQVRVRVEQLLEHPDLPPSAYDAPTDQWITTYGDGAGLIVCAIVREHQAVVILRLS